MIDSLLIAVHTFASRVLSLFVNISIFKENFVGNEK